MDQIRGLSIKLILSIFEGDDKELLGDLDSKLDPNFLVHIFKRKLASIEVTSKKDLVKYLKANEIDEENNLRTQFPDEIMDLLNILIIYEKLLERLGSSCRIVSGFAKVKEEL